MKRYIYVMLILLTIVNSSCKKFIEIGPPKNLTVTEKVFKTDEAAISAMLNIYILMNNSNASPYYTAALLGLAADEFKNYSNGFQLYYTNAYNQNDQPILDFWAYGYNLIYQANAVYEGCSQSTSISPQIKKQLMAEALFIRAYWHFYLVNLYGEIVVTTTTDYETNRKLNRVGVEEVYQVIISDLIKAETDLADNYLMGDTKTNSLDRVRPNKSVANALLAKVYLYHHDFQMAETAATKIINNSAVYRLAPISSAFLKNSPEAIWQLARPLPNATTLNTYEALYFTLSAKPGTALARSLTLSDELYNIAFETGDQRKISWVGRYTDIGVTPNINYYYPAKYRSTSTLNTDECTIVLRVAEQFLIRAEARANLENISGAQSDLNVVRSRAGLGNTPANTKNTLITAILNERRVELFSEYGHRWFDLKRLGVIDNVMTSFSSTKNSTWSSYMKLLPIPKKDIENGLGLKQNEGYN
jgi:hypothetical protein